MSSCGRRGCLTRHGGKRKTVNRYNPNSPDYNAVHHSFWHRAILGPAHINTDMMLASVYLAGKRLRETTKISINEKVPGIRAFPSGKVIEPLG